MKTANSSHSVVVAPRQRQSEAPAYRLVRLAVPMLFAAMGISLGTVAGVATAFFSIPTAGAAVTTEADNTATAQQDVSSANQAVSTPQQNVSATTENTSAAYQMAAVAVPAGVPSVNASDSSNSVVSQPSPTTVSAERPVKVESIPAVDGDKTPAAEKTASPEQEPAETRPAKHLAHPVTRPLRNEMAAVQDAAPVLQLDDEQMAQNIEDVKPAVTYSEGDITVEGYDAEVGTIQTSDGRTFSVGETVSMGQVTPWEDYRANVHYRCEQGGSCVLQRAGAVSVNAHQI
jgi:hypothetical protein